MTEAVLSKLPLCRDMSAEQRQTILDFAHHVTVGPGDQIITQGQLKQNLWIILTGRCQVSRRTEGGCQLELAQLEPGTQFGEMSFFHPSPHSADVVALTAVELLRISRADYDRWFASGDPVALKLTLNCVEQLAERLRRMDSWITNLVCDRQSESSTSEWTSFREICFRGQ